jgi:hypothetical protein
VKRVCALLAAVMLLAAFVVPGTASANQSPCQGYFISQATVELPAGYWTEGVHHNTMRFLGWGGDETWGPFEFTVSDSAPLYKGQVMVAAALIGAGWAPIPDQTINPAQDTFLWAGWGIGPGDYPNMPAANADLDQASILFSWDGGDEVLADQGPYTSFCATGGVSMFHRSFGPVVSP